MFSLFLFLAQTLSVFAASGDDWRSRSIYQVVIDRFAQTSGSTTASCNTADQIYCGGTWQGLINKLDYIQDMGFTAVWISPVTKQVNVSSGNPDGESYHGYWQTDLSSLNPAFGTESDLKSLSSALHDRDMYLMVDVVVNHFGWDGSESEVDYSSYFPFNESSYFHNFCQVTDDDYNDNQTAVEVCWMGDPNVELTDVNTTHPEVNSAYSSWISSLVSTYSIDGLRIDTVRNVQQSFFPSFVSSSGVYAVGEIFDGSISTVCPYQSYVPGVLNYPLYYTLTSAFSSTSGNMSALASTINSMKSDCNDTTLMGSFLENHDNPRFPSLTSDIAAAQNAIGLSMLSDGIPIVYEGQEQHYAGGAVPANREAVWLAGYNTQSTLYGFIAKLNQLRNHIVSADAEYTTSKADVIYTDTTTIALSKQSLVGVWSNKGSQGASYSQSISGTGYSNGTIVLEVVGCKNQTVSGNGTLEVAMGKGAPKVFYPASGLGGSGVCGM